MVANKLEATPRDRSSRLLVRRVHGPPQFQLSISHIFTKGNVVHPRLERWVKELEPTICTVADVEDQAFTQKQMFESKACRDSCIRDTTICA